MVARCGSEDARATDTTVLPTALTKKNVGGTSVTDCVCVLERERACVSVLRAGEAVELSLRLTSHPDGAEELTLRSTFTSSSLLETYSSWNIVQCRSQDPIHLHISAAA
jgi:hypothetical protein